MERWLDSTPRFAATTCLRCQSALLLIPHCRPMSLHMELLNLNKNMRRRRIKYLLTAVILLYILYSFFGIGDHINARSFEENFDYPLNTNIKPLIAEVLAGKKPQVKPINYYPHRYLTNSGKCSTVDKLDLFIVVKSAMNHFGNRMAIRQTYGQESITPGRITKILFFLGVNERKSETQTQVEAEMAKFKDIIQIDFIDTYFNNTIKTMMSFRWLFEHCSTADFYLFTDDDMYVSVPNLFDYLGTMSTGNSSLLSPQDQFYAGYMFKSAPHRIVLSKWRISIDEYPWDMWPPYVTAGSYVVSNRSMKELYVASLFVKHFRFDDIYLGIVAKKAGIVPTHCDKFYFYKKPYSRDGYRDVITSHGYDDHELLVTVWNEQNNIVSSSR